jgi:methylenetetrahydrofolate dehydrogenase (NADP+)/methenyltetrahydrofolate cyclohydrolase
MGDMSAKLIDGKASAARLRARIAEEAKRLKAAHGITPVIAVVLVGDDPASAVYVAAKGKAVAEAGFIARDLRFPAFLNEADLIAEVANLNRDPSVHGILVQMPLPPQIEARHVINAIHPDKDVDGLSSANAGRLMLGEFGLSHGLVACTPLGAMMLIRETMGRNIAGANALVIGRSNLVGKPMGQLLLQENCTVTMAHSKTRDLQARAAEADILIAAAGRADLVRGSWIKKGATVIDIGTNRKEVEKGKFKLVGDVVFEEAVEVAGAITPVPGGAGPMTIACLMRNTLIAACLKHRLAEPDF